MNFEENLVKLEQNLEIGRNFQKVWKRLEKSM